MSNPMVEDMFDPTVERVSRPIIEGMSHATYRVSLAQQPVPLRAHPTPSPLTPAKAGVGTYFLG